MVNWYQKKFSTSSDLLHTCSCPFLCLVLVLTWQNGKPDQGVKPNFSFVLTPNSLVAGNTDCGCCGQGGRGEGTCPGWQALECSHWQQVCCNQVYCHPIAPNTSPQVQGENKPRVSFSRRVPVTPCHRGERGWRVSGLEHPECGAAAGPAPGLSALRTTGRGCSDKNLEMPGKKSVAETPNSY